MAKLNFPIFAETKILSGIFYIILYYNKIRTDVECCYNSNFLFLYILKLN